MAARFFALLYGRKDKQALDQAGVLELCKDHKGDPNFPFETIALAMRSIDETMVPVIVGKEDDDKDWKLRSYRDFTTKVVAGGQKG